MVGGGCDRCGSIAVGVVVMSLLWCVVLQVGVFGSVGKGTMPRTGYVTTVCYALVLVLANDLMLLWYLGRGVV